ncbi:MAG: hypothetical protein AAF573_04365 [Bacteroidota bacterium]
MEGIIDKLLLKDKIEYQGSFEELKKRLNDSKNRKYRVEWISDKEFKFLSNWSLGTMIVNGLPGAVDGIKGYGTIKDLKENNKIEIQLKTKVRIEMYFITGIFVFFFVVGILSKEKFPIWIYFLLPIFLIWFWGVYRIQENSLFKKVKQHLKN